MWGGGGGGKVYLLFLPPQYDNLIKILFKMCLEDNLTISREYSLKS